MNTDRIDYYANQLRGTLVSNLGRKLREVIREATDEAQRDENKACATLVESKGQGEIAPAAFFANAIRARIKQ